MLNKIFIMGRLTRDPEMRRTNGGLLTASFTVAVDRDYAQQGAERKTDFIDCVAWNKTAEFIEKYFKKGSMAVVCGRLQLRDWTGNDGIKRRAAEINVENIYFGESKRDSSSSYNPAPQTNYQSNYSAPSYGGGNYGSYSSPVSGSDFAELDDDDGNLPF